MRIPPNTDSTGRSSSVRQPADGSAPAGSSLIVPLQPQPSADDSPTIITPVRHMPSDPALGLVTGSRLSHFEVIGSIGAGGMATVLKARDLELNRVVALKILPPQMARDPEHIIRFKQEGRAAAQLDHDNIARVFFCGEDQGLHFIAFEFVEGENLRVLIDQLGQVPPADCVRYMIQVATGLAHAGERGVVHRDIKPSNIIITPDGRAKIVDMGLARNMSQTAGGVTHSGVTLGTFDYISPEQALDPRRADIRSDIYSLGCAFYHALTGKPPVPEGTAAKKLHAHQNESVLDPRVLNPAVSDELAAVLSKMMAKEPARRYQSPTDLIVALTVLARKLNVSPDAIPSWDPALLPPDASKIHLLPEPPRVPLSLVLGVVTVLVAIVVLLGLSSGSNPTGRAAAPTWLESSPGIRGLQPGEQGTAVNASGVGSTGAATNGAPQTAANVEELARLLQTSEGVQIRLQAGRLYDLTTLTAGVLSQAKRIELENEPGMNPPVVRLAAYPAVPQRMTAPPRGSLTFTRAELVRFRGIRFEITEGPVAENPDERPVGLLVADVGRLEIQDCRFEADRLLLSTDVAGLAVLRDPKDSATTVNIRNCLYSLRRGVAVQLAGRIQADVSETAFAPHPTVFDLHAEPDSIIVPGEPSELRLRHCSFLQDRGVVLDVDPGARWDVSAGYCVFAAKPTDPSAVVTTINDQAHRKPAIVLVHGDAPGIRFTGRPNEANAYYQVDAITDGTRGYSLEESRQRWAMPLLSDPAALDMKQQSPWESADPVAELEKPEPWAAYRLKTNLPQLRVRGDEVLLGIREFAGRKVYSPWPPPPIDQAAEQRVRVWWPNMPAEQANQSRGVYSTLDEAIAALRPGDELQIRHTGFLPVPQQVLAKPKLRVTIKPEAGSAPVLTPAASNLYEPTLFKMVDGEELILEGLEIRLRPRPAKSGDIRSQSAVTIVGGRQCTLRNCVITGEPLEDEKLAAVILTDPAGEMRTEDDRRPRVQFENCLIRGKSRAVWVQAARPFDLDLSNTVTAIAGPVIVVDPAGKAPAMGVLARIRLIRVTAALAGPLLDLRPGRTPMGSKTASWVPLEVEAERSLFASVERDFPLVAIDGGDPTMPSHTMTWAQGVGGVNLYANYPAGAVLMTVQPVDESFEPKMFDATAWFAFTNEKAERSAGQVQFAAMPGAIRKLSTVKATDFVVEMVTITGSTPLTTDAGADMKLIARPTDDTPTDP